MKFKDVLRGRWASLDEVSLRDVVRMAQLADSEGNGERAAIRISRVLVGDWRSGSAEPYEFDEAEQTVRDVLMDLMHLCDLLDLDFQQCLDWAWEVKTDEADEDAVLEQEEGTA